MIIFHLLKKSKGFNPAVKGTSNNYQFVTPAPDPVRGKLRRESSDVRGFWIPAFAGMTFLEVALSIEYPPRLFLFDDLFESILNKIKVFHSINPPYLFAFLQPITI